MDYHKKVTSFQQISGFLIVDMINGTLILTNSLGTGSNHELVRSFVGTYLIFSTSRPLNCSTRMLSRKRTINFELFSNCGCAHRRKYVHSHSVLATIVFVQLPPLYVDFTLTPKRFHVTVFCRNKVSRTHPRI